MSRTIKFRVWDGKRMWDVISIDFKARTAVVEVGITEDWKLLTKTIEYELCVEFTGLFDSEGTKIYEGDRLVLAGEYADGDTSAFTVAWVDGAFWKRYDDWSKNVGFPLLYDRLDMWRVVGNIHESELIDG